MAFDVWEMASSLLAREQELIGRDGTWFHSVQTSEVDVLMELMPFLQEQGLAGFAGNLRDSSRFGFGGFSDSGVHRIHRAAGS